MKKNAIKIALVGLGVAGTAFIGGMSVDLDAPEPVVEDSKVIVHECLGEEFEVGKEDVCLDESNYTFLKSVLKTKKLDDDPLYLWTDAGRLHLAILNHEMKKQDKQIELEGSANAVEIFDLANKIL